MNDFDEVKLCTEYIVDGKRTQTFPLDLPDIDSLEPRYQSMPGWNQSLEHCDSFEELPAEAKDYLKFIQDYLGVDLTILSKGPGRTETIVI